MPLLLSARYTPRDKGPLGIWAVLHVCGLEGLQRVRGAGMHLIAIDKKRLMLELLRGVGVPGALGG